MHVLNDISLFAEDELRAGSRLAVRLGVRYQNQFWPPKITDNVPGLAPYGWPADNNNIAPRVGVSWEPLGDRKTYLHGAYGIFYDNHISSLWALATGISGTEDHVQTLILRRADAYRAWRMDDRKWPEPTGKYSGFAYSIQPDLKTPYAHHASLGFDRELGRNQMVSADLVIVRGFNQVGSIDYMSGPVWRQYTSWGKSWYRGLTLSLARRFAGSYGFVASYTLSKAEDLMADFAFQQPQEPGKGRNPADPGGLPLDFDPNSERGPSLHDQRHRLVFSGVYVMPHGFTLSAMVNAGSGRPFNILAGADLNGNGDPADRPRTDPADPSSSIGRNSGLLPGTFTFDIRLAKQLPIGSRMRLRLTLDVFNLVDRTNYTQVATTSSDPGRTLVTLCRAPGSSPKRDRRSRRSWPRSSRSEPAQLGATLTVAAPSPGGRPPSCRFRSGGLPGER